MAKLSRVLLVDDDTTTNYLNERLLNRLDVAEQVFVALDGAQALAHLQEHCAAAAPECPVLILLDLNMPGMSGLDFLKAYQQLPVEQRPATVIIVLTTSLHPFDMGRVQQFPVAGFLDKPLNEQKLNQLLYEHFGRSLPARP